MRLSILVVSMLLLASLQAMSGEHIMGSDSGAINGSVYCDQNQDGQCDCDENGLRDIHIQVFTGHCGGMAQQTIHTDENGKFSFHINQPGTYFVMVDLQYVCGGRVPTTSICQKVELAAGETVQLEPFGYSVLGQ